MFLELHIALKVGTSPMCWVEPGLVPCASFAGLFPQAGLYCGEDLDRLFPMASPSSPVASRRGGTFCHPVLCSPRVVTESESPYSFPLSSTLRFAGGSVPCAPEHPPGLFNTGPYTWVSCVWVGTVGGVDATHGAAAQVKFPLLSPGEGGGHCLQRVLLSRGLSYAGLLFLQVKPRFSSALKVDTFLLGERPVSAPC